MLHGSVRVTLDGKLEDLVCVRSPAIEVFISLNTLYKTDSSRRVWGAVTWGDVQRLVDASHPMRTPTKSGVFLTQTWMRGKTPG